MISQSIRDRMRRMTESDREDVARMMRVFYASDAVLSNGSEEIYQNDITACVSDSPYASGFVFLDEEGKVAGYAMIAHSYSTEFGKPCIWIEDIYLEKSLRGQGFASGFFDYLIEEFPDAVHRLEAEHENEHAVAVYYAKGFDEIPYVEFIRNK